MAYVNELIDNIKPLFEKNIDQPIGEWLEENITLVNTSEGLGGLKKPNFKDFPDIAQIFEDVKDPDVKDIQLMFSAQSTKTFFLMMICIWLLKKKSYEGMFALSDINQKNKVRERFKSILKANKDFLGWDDSRGATKGDTFVFDNGAKLSWGILSSPSTIAGDPCDFVLSDEYDEYASAHNKNSVNALRQLQKRTQAKKHGILINGSTPKLTKGRGGILDLYENRKAHRNVMPCPKCGSYETFTINDIKVREFNENDVGEIRVKGLGYAECPSCGEELTDADHFTMSRQTKFIPLEGSEEKSNVEKSYHKAVWHTISKNWTDTMYDYHSHKMGGPTELADFFNSMCAQPQAVNMRETQTDVIKLDYNKGFAPPDTQFLILGADIGGERLHLSVVGFANKGRKYLVDWEEYNYGGRSNFKELEHKFLSYILDKEYTTTDGKPLKVLYGAIDSNYYTSDVYDLCEKIRQLIPVVGSGTLKTKWKQVDADPKNNWGYKNSHLKRFELGHNYFQDVFDAALNRSYDEGSCFCFPNDVWANYLDHLQNMIQVLKPDGVTWEWKQKSSYRRVDFRDTAIYAIALYEFLNLSTSLRTQSERKVEKKEQKPKKSFISSMY